MIEIECGIIDHADPLHHRTAAMVIGVGNRPDGIVGQIVECPLHRCNRRFGDIALAPGRRRHPPTRLGLAFDRGARPPANDPAPADKLRILLALHRPEAIAFLLLHPVHPRHQRRDFIAAHQRPECFHDDGVGTDAMERIDILFAPLAQDEAQGFDAEFGHGVLS